MQSHLNFLFYIPEDGHMIGRNMYEFVVCIKLILV
jgi:hypothetical protein